MGDAKIRYQLSVTEAARRLGLTEGAVRQRIRRGTLVVRRKNRRLYVLLGEADVADPTGPEADDTRIVRHVDAATGPGEPAPSGTDKRTVRDRSAEPSAADRSDSMVPRRELDRAREAYDELAEAWARDLRHQLGRLEREVDRLQGELSEMRKRHAEEMRRKDVLLQGNQEALTAWISHMTGAPRVLSPTGKTDA